MRRLNRTVITYILLFSIGVIVRLFLIFFLPIWIDETSAIRVSQTNPAIILLGSADEGHPPGYYLLLKLWSTPTIHLFWMRLLGFFLFIINSFLLYSIGKKYRNHSFGLILSLLYSLSGYFIIFDWQVRMHTGLLTFILLSLLSMPSANNLKQLIRYTLINFLGLYFDFGFFWYLFPLLFIYLFKLIRKFTSGNFKLMISVISSIILFLCAYPYIFKNFSVGLQGISWVQNYLSPRFFIPFFFGSISNVIGTIYVGLVFAVGVILAWKRGLRDTYSVIIYVASCISLISALFISYLYKPLFHVRSLQIVGLAILFAVAEVFFLWFSQKKYFLSLIGYLLSTYCLLHTAYIIVNKPDLALINYIHWRDIIQSYHWNATDYVYYEVQPDDMTYILKWSLGYTLNGYETAPVKKIPFYTNNPALLSPSCQLINEVNIRIYKCSKSSI